MRLSNREPSDGQIVDTMLQLARAAKSNRLIVVGPASSEIYRELHRRGHPHATTTKLAHIPCGQYDIAMVAWRERSIKAFEATLVWLLHFLNHNGVLVVWPDEGEGMGRELRLTFDRLGFRVEAGSHCENGVATSARRFDLKPAAKAA